MAQKKFPSEFDEKTTLEGSEVVMLDDGKKKTLSGILTWMQATFGGIFASLTADETIGGDKVFSGDTTLETLQVTKSKNLTASTDLNTITSGGFYDVQNAVNKPTGSTSRGYLVVQRFNTNDKYVYQEYIDMTKTTESGIRYWRTMNNEVRKDWKTINDSSGFAFDADVVHNTGAETISGSKSFTSIMTVLDLIIKGANTNHDQLIEFSDGTTRRTVRADNYNNPNSETLNIENESGDQVMTLLQDGKVGIGTNDPSNKLHVKGSGSIGSSIESSNGGEATLDLKSGATITTLFYRDSDGDFGIYHQGVTRYRIDGATLENWFDGDVKIFDSLTVDEQIILPSTDNISTGSNFANRKAPLLIGTTASGTNGILIDTNQIEQTNNSNAIYINNTSSADVILVNGGGDVGIGTGSPESLLHLKSVGDAELIIEADSDNSGENDNPKITLKQDGGAAYGAVQMEGDANTLVNGSITNALILSARQVIQFIVNQVGTDILAMTIQTNGYVGIGTNAPSEKLHVNDVARIDNLLIGEVTSYGSSFHGLMHTSMSGTGDYALLQGSDGTTYINSKAGKTLNFRQNNSTIFYVNTSGEIITATTINDVDIDDTGRITPTLLNSRVNYGGARNTCQYRKINGVVYIKGLVKSGTGSTFFTLPIGYRPPGDCKIVGIQNANAAKIFEIDTSGNVVHTGGSISSVYVALEFSFAV